MAAGPAGGAFKSASKFLKYFENGRGFYSVLKKVKMVSAGEGRCTCELELTEEHLNAGDTLHGGLTATLVDTISTVAITTTNNPPGISTDLNVTYMRPAKKGDTISIVAECLKVGKTMAFVNVDIFNKSDGNKVIAQGRHTKFI